MLVRKRRPIHASRHSLFDILSGEIRAERAIRVGKSATDITTKTGAAGHDLWKFGVRFDDSVGHLVGKRIYARISINLALILSPFAERT
jgi:hypothetical protein